MHGLRDSLFPIEPVGVLVPKEVSVSSNTLLSMRFLDCLWNTSGEPSRLLEQREGGRDPTSRSWLMLSYHTLVWTTSQEKSLTFVEMIGLPR